jgi:predicted dehydrogenase
VPGDEAARDPMLEGLDAFVGETPSPRRGPWPPPPTGRPPPVSGPWWASTSAGCRRSPWPASWSPAGRLGAIRHVRGAYLGSHLLDPELPLIWRLQAEQAGSGALGDLGAHAIDLAQYLAGDRITGVSALTETFVRERPLADGSGARGPVTVDDAALFIARFAGGALGAFEATRFATGHTEGLRVELNAELGSVVWELGSLNELRLFDATEPPATQGFRTIQVTRAGHPYAGAWWPDGHAIGYEHTFTHEVRDLLHAIADGRDPVPSFADGLQVQEVLDAAQRSAASGSGWTQVGH